MKLKLSLEAATFEKLHNAADGRGRQCRVSKEDLGALLQDHSRALAVIEQLGVEIEEEGRS